jgi:hypothetical protein
MMPPAMDICQDGVLGEEQIVLVFMSMFLSRWIRHNGSLINLPLCPSALTLKI